MDTARTETTRTEYCDGMAVSLKTIMSLARKLDWRITGVVTYTRQGLSQSRESGSRGGRGHGPWCREVARGTPDNCISGLAGKNSYRLRPHGPRNDYTITVCVYDRFLHFAQKHFFHSQMCNQMPRRLRPLSTTWKRCYSTITKSRCHGRATGSRPALIVEQKLEKSFRTL